MGNCIDCQKKPASWIGYGDVDDDEELWEFESVEYRMKKARTRATEAGGDEDILRPLKDDKDFGGSGGGSAGTEIKIRISKKQVERMLQQSGAGSSQLQKLLADLASFGEAVQEREQEQQVRHWRPTLQSIAE